MLNQNAELKAVSGTRGHDLPLFKLDMTLLINYFNEQISRH